MHSVAIPKFHNHHQAAVGARSPLLHTRRDSRDSVGRYSSASPEPGSPSFGSGTRSSSSPGRSPCTCTTCGKRYKHRSCLHKHLWEHHAAWDACLKYNLTKHQQVQMMEAAQVLVDMMGVKSA